MYYFYLPFGTFGVTQYYLDIMKDALICSGHDVKIVSTLGEIPLGSSVVTTGDKDTVKVGLKIKPQNLIVWYQGVSPEEMVEIYKGRWDKLPRVAIHRFMERYSLSKSTLNVFVSEAMLNHYRKRYGYKGENYVIMPCFGNGLDVDSIKSSRYTKPKFLYSGSIAPWQCVDEMLELFKKIKNRLPDATLNILTPDGEQAKALLEKHGVVAIVDFVAPDALQNYIREFKYGFIVRKDLAMNRVATPTKMNNYMGAGIIPVYSDIVEDYNKRITQKTRFAIPFIKEDDCIEKIIELEKRGVDIEEMKSQYGSIFKDYWNREEYVKKISKEISRFYE